MNVNEAQEQWDSINAKLKQLTEEYRSGERWQDETKRMFWEIAEIQDDKQELYNKMIHDWFIPISGVGEFGKWKLTESE